MKHCAPVFQQFKRVYFVGASHQGINTNCLSHLCPRSNIHHLKVQLSPNLIRFFNETLLSIQNDSFNQYAFVIQFGSWDLNSYVFCEVIAKYIPAFARNINNIYTSKRHEYPHVKLLVMSAPSLPDKDPKKGNLVDRNNWMSAVFAKTLRRHMEAIDIDFLDEFAFTFPLYYECCTCPRTPNHHYSMWYPQTHTCSGNVGQAFMALFTSRICPNMNMV